MSLDTNYITRLLCPGQTESAISIGFLDTASLPVNFCITDATCYSCSLILSDTTFFSEEDDTWYFLHRGDVFQVFPQVTDTTDNVTILRKLLQRGSDISSSLFHLRLCASTWKALSEMGLVSTASVFHIPMESFMDNWMPALIEQLKNTPQKNLFEVYLNMQKFLITLHQSALSATRSNQQVIESAKQLLSDTSLRELSLPDLATSLGLGYENFRKLFKEETGLSPLQYALDTKFHLAQRFLTEGMSVKEVATALGYADPYIFSKQFKKYIGQSPSCFKKTGSHNEPA